MSHGHSNKPYDEQIRDLLRTDEVPPAIYSQVDALLDKLVLSTETKVLDLLLGVVDSSTATVAEYLRHGDAPGARSYEQSLDHGLKELKKQRHQAHRP